MGKVGTTLAVPMPFQPPDQEILESLAFPISVGRGDRKCQFAAHSVDPCRTEARSLDTSPCRCCLGRRIVSNVCIKGALESGTSYWKQTVLACGGVSHPLRHLAWQAPSH